MAKRQVIRNAEGKPFSSWKPADKFAHMLTTRHPQLASEVTTEFVFDDGRKWRFDYAWPSELVAVEIDGFGYGHQAQQNIAAGHEKQNAAIAQGWKVMRYCSRQLGSIAGVEDAVDQVAQVLCRA